MNAANCCYACGRQPGQVSALTFLPDRMQVREELTGPHVDDFARRLQHVTQTAVERLGIPIIVAQQHVVRMLINPKRYADSREFLGSAMCRIPADDFAPFGRPIGLFGVKLIFPASEPGGDVHTLRIESFNQDPRCVFIEDVATFTTQALDLARQLRFNPAQKNGEPVESWVQVQFQPVRQ